MFQLLVCGTRYGTQGLLFHDPTSSILACRTIRAPLRSRSCPCNWRCRLAIGADLIYQRNSIFCPECFYKVWFKSDRLNLPFFKCSAQFQWMKICIEGETDQTVKCILKFYWKRPDTMRIWDRCKILLRIFLCKARLNEAAINFVKLGCHIWSQQDLWWQMRVILRWPCQCVLLILKTFLLSVWGHTTMSICFKSAK